MEQMNSADRVKELSAQLRQGVVDLFASGQYAEYLTTMSRFHHYSWRNSIIIHLQNPHSTHVAGFHTWKNLGRNVNKSEKGLAILAPAPYKKTIESMHDEDGKLLAEPTQREITCTTFKVVYVFDVSQTNGKELPRLADQLTGEIGEYERMMQALKNISPYPIEFEKIDGGANGYCDYQAQRIAIREGVSQEQAVKTGIHEIAHAAMHNPDQKIDRQTAEVQAESVAYIVCNYFGVDSSQYSFGYVAGWSAGQELSVLEDSLEAIREGAAGIIDRLEKELEHMRGYIRAGDLRPGAQLAEADGFLFDVAEVVKQTDQTITVRLCSDFSSFKDHWTIKPDGTPGGVLKTFQKDTLLSGIPAPASSLKEKLADAKQRCTDQPTQEKAKTQKHEMSR